MFRHEEFITRLNALTNKSLVEGIWELIYDFPSQRGHIFQFVAFNKQLIQKYYNIRLLLKVFPERKEDIFSIINNAGEFWRILNPINNKLFDLFDLINAIEDFPDHKRRIFELLPGNLLQLRLSKLDNTSDLYRLCQLYPDQSEEIYQHIKNRQIFRKLVDNVSIFCALALEELPFYREKLLQILFDPTVFKHIIPEPSNLNHLAKFFPEYSKIFTKPSVDEAAKEALKYSAVQNAYTRGATMGLFKGLLPDELANQIGSYLERGAGGRVAQVTSVAVETAEIEAARFEKF